MKNLYGWGAYFVGVCGFCADAALVVLIVEHPYSVISGAAAVALYAITAIVIALCCILVYLSRHED